MMFNILFVKGTMSVEEKKIIIFQDIIDHFERDYYSNLSEAVIPFTNFGERKEDKYIYHGHEKIPFEKRDPSYQKILKREFLHG